MPTTHDRNPRPTFLGVATKHESVARVNPEKVVRKMLAAYARNDIEGVVATLDPSYVVHGPFAGTAKGREAGRKTFETIFKVFTDQEVKILNIMTKGHTVASEYKWAATFSGPLQTSQGTLPPNGRRLEFAAVEFFRVNSKGLITEERAYYDSYAIVKQLSAKT